MVITIDRILNDNLANIRAYFNKRYFTFKPSKTVSIALHFNNRDAQRKLNLRIRNYSIANEEHPKYLGVKIDISLIYKQHLEGVKNMTKTRNNIIAKFAGTGWDANETFLRSSAIALVYSVTEYCAPVWVRSAHCTKVDI